MKMARLVATHVSAQQVIDMEAIDIETYAQLTPKQKVCEILCGRILNEDCESDNGSDCREFGKDFATLAQEEGVSEIQYNDFEDDEEDEEEEGLFEIIIGGDKKCDDSKSVYDEKDE
jgi:hypothetical protein